MFYKFRCAVARFMYGRNGMDQLNRALVWVYLAVCVLRAISQVRHSNTILTVWDAVIWLLFIFIMYRMLSKNLNQRRIENQKFMSALWKAKNNAAGAKARRADKDHKYFTCKCGAICRVPVGKGKVVITCPKCGNQIQGKT